jgi:hypothetical protein
VPSGSQPHSAANSRTFRIKTQDFEDHIHLLSPTKQAVARRIFPKDSTGRFMKADKMTLIAFTMTLTPQERNAFGKLIKDKQMFARPEFSRLHKGPAPKDTGRFTLEPDPQAKRPGSEGHPPPSVSLSAGPSGLAKDADLYPIHGLQNPAPQRTAQQPSPAPSGKAEAKPGPSSPPPPRATLAELFEADKPGRSYSFSELYVPSRAAQGQESPLSLHTQSPPGPSGIPKRPAQYQESGPAREAGGPGRAGRVRMEVEVEVAHEIVIESHGPAPEGHGHAPEEHGNATAPKHGALQRLKDFIKTPIGIATAAGAAALTALAGLFALGSGSGTPQAQSTPVGPNPPVS